MKKLKEAKEKSAIKISRNRDSGKKKVDLFANFRMEHPLDDLFPVEHELIVSPQKELTGAKNSISGDAENNLAGTDNVISGETQKELTGINVPEINKRGDAKNDKSGIIIPAKEINATHKLKNKPATGKRGRPATGRTKADVHLRVNRDIWQKTRVFCAENSFELSQFVELTLVRFMDNFTSPQNELAGINVPLDDRRLMLTSKSSTSLINLYLAYNHFFNHKTKWTVSDDEAGYKFNSVDLRIIELAFIQTHFNKGFHGKINSFQYYTGQIEEMLQIEFTSETLETMLKINRQKWTQMTKTELNLSFLKLEN